MFGITQRHSLLMSVQTYLFHLFCLCCAGKPRWYRDQVTHKNWGSITTMLNATEATYRNRTCVYPLIVPIFVSYPCRRTVIDVSVNIVLYNWRSLRGSNPSDNLIDSQVATPTAAPTTIFFLDFYSNGSDPENHPLPICYEKNYILQ